MKKIPILITVGLLLICSSCNLSGRKDRKGDGKLSGNISISGAFALYPMTVKWAEEFKKVYPDIQIDISAGGAGKGMADALSKMVDLGMFSREVTMPEEEKGAWKIALTKDAVLPTINANNPFIEELLTKGATKEEFYKLFVSGEIRTWEEMLDRPPSTEITVFTRSDACGAAAMWGKWLGVNQEDLIGLGVFGDPGVADAVKADRHGIGFNNVAYVFDIGTRKKYNKMEVLPVDLDNDGLISKEENFYGSLDEIGEAIKEGRYPSPPARELYFVAKGKPEREIVILFIEWILTDGQRFVQEAGYVPLSDQRITEELEKLRN